MAADKKPQSILLFVEGVFPFYLDMIFSGCDRVQMK